MAPSILKQKSKSPKSESRNVSFGVNSSRTIASSSASAARNEDPKKTHFLHDEEEDAFDPNDNNDHNDDGIDDDGMDDKQIRIAKAARATKRALHQSNPTSGGNAANILGLEEEEEESRNSKMRNRKNKRKNRMDQQDGMFDGEEEVDRHLSLINPDDDNDFMARKPSAMEDEGEEEDNNRQNPEKMQCPVEPFNLEAEREDGMGYFDGDTYVFRRRNAALDEEEDAWLDNLGEERGKDEGKLSTQDTERAMNSFVKRTSKYSGDDTTAVMNADQGSNNKQGSGTIRSLDENMSKLQVYEQLLPLLATPQETVIQALGRYGTILKREKKVKQRNNQKQNNDNNSNSTSSNTNTSNSASRKSLEKLTELANFYMMKFNDGGSIYEHDRRYFDQMLHSQNGDGTHRQHSGQAKQKHTTNRSYFSKEEDSMTSQSKRFKVDATHSTSPTPPTTTCTNVKDIQWEYKGNQDNQIHGPYTTRQMIDWTSAGYFVGGMAVDIRIVGGVSGGDGVGRGTDVTSKDEGVVEDLLGDLDDSDDDGGNDCTTTLQKIGQEWQRSDKINFVSYL